MRVFPLRMSSADTWDRCRAFPNLTRGRNPLPGDSTVRDEGIACHWAAHQLWQGVPVTTDTVAPNGIRITDEMLDTCDLYLDVIRSWGVPATLEVQLAAPDIHPEAGGTPDAWAFNPSANILHVADLKFGFRPIEVFENKQLLMAASAIISHLCIDGYADQTLMVEFAIIQPRTFKREGAVSLWRVPAIELRFFFSKLSMSAHEAMDPNAKATPGPQCDNCDARYDCKTLHTATMSALELSEQGTMLELPPVALSDELRRIERALSILEARKSGLVAQGFAMMQRGEMLPWHEVGRGTGRTRWIEGKEAEVAAIARLMNVDVFNAPKLLTPIQAAKILPASVVSKLSEKLNGEAKLVEFKSSTIRKVFSQTQ